MGASYGEEFAAGTMATGPVTVKAAEHSPGLSRGPCGISIVLGGQENSAKHADATSSLALAGKGWGWGANDWVREGL